MCLNDFSFPRNFDLFFLGHTEVYLSETDGGPLSRWYCHAIVFREWFLRGWMDVDLHTRLSGEEADKLWLLSEQRQVEPFKIKST